MDLVTLTIAGTLVTAGASTLPLATCFEAEQVTAIAMGGLGLSPAEQLGPSGVLTHSYFEAKPAEPEGSGDDQAGTTPLGAVMALDAVRELSNGVREP